MHLACKAVVDTEPHTYPFPTLYHVLQTAVFDDNVVVQAAPAWQGLRWRPSTLSGSTTPRSRTLPGLTSTTLPLPPTERCITLFVLLADVNAVCYALMSRFTRHACTLLRAAAQNCGPKMQGNILIPAWQHPTCYRAALPTWHWHWHWQQ